MNHPFCCPVAAFTRKLRWEVNFHLKTQIGDVWFLSGGLLISLVWQVVRNLHLNCLDHLLYLYWVVGQKKLLSLPYPLLLDLTSHSIGSFFSNMDTLLLTTVIVICIGFSLSPITVWMLFKMTWKICLGFFSPGEWHLTKWNHFTLKAGFTNIGLTRNVDSC